MAARQALLASFDDDDVARESRRMGGSNGGMCMSQQEVADELGITRVVVQGIERTAFRKFRAALNKNGLPREAIVDFLRAL
jgi:DNA-directed RNA polymerase sigma subunit (sigma70/sigma32)